MGVCLKWPFPNFYIQFNKLELYTLSRTLTGEDSPPLTALNLAILQVFLVFVIFVPFATLQNHIIFEVKHYIHKIIQQIKTSCCRTCGYQMLKSEIFNHSRFFERIICVCIHCSQKSFFSYTQRYFLSEWPELIYTLFICKILSFNMSFGFIWWKALYQSISLKSSLPLADRTVKYYFKSKAFSYFVA